MRAKLPSACGGLLLLGLLAAAPVQADEYDPQRAGHPVRFAAYLLHPVGVLLDRLILRPAHWLGHQEPFQAIFGHQD